MAATAGEEGDAEGDAEDEEDNDKENGEEGAWSAYAAIRST